MKGEIVSFYAADGIRLHGFLSRPIRKSDKAVIHIHGLEGSFYHNNFVKLLSSALTHNGVNFFTIELRGSYNVFEPGRRGGGGRDILMGGDLERFEDCVYDIEGAIRYLRSIGIRKIFLEGHSTGCQKITYYQHTKKDKRIAGLILIAPMDDYNINNTFMGKNFTKAEGVALRNYKRRKDMQMPKEYTNGIISVARFLSLTNLDFVEARLFNYESKKLVEFSKIRIPIFAIFGGEDQYAVKPVQVYSRILKRDTRSKAYKDIIIKGGDHAFRGKEQLLAREIVRWVRSQS